MRTPEKQEVEAESVAYIVCDAIRMESQDIDFPGAAEVLFTDSSGPRWRRDFDGRLFAMESREVRGVTRRVWRRKREPV